MIPLAPNSELRFAVAAALCRRRGGASSANKRQEAQVHIAAPTERGGYKNRANASKFDLGHHSEAPT
ncbi:MAG: hypothetical protein WCP06_07680, partial [Verrucomicrobiota bacterium]